LICLIPSGKSISGFAVVLLSIFGRDKTTTTTTTSPPRKRFFLVFQHLKGKKGVAFKNLKFIAFRFVRRKFFFLNNIS
jgi:hypothetical protein